MDYFSKQDDLIRDGESSNPTNLARDLLAKFNRSVILSSLETCISLHREALRLLPSLRFECLPSVALAFMLRFRHTSQMRDLDEAISLLFRNLLLSIQANRPNPGMLASISAAFLTKFIVTGSELYRQGALTGHSLLQVCAADSWAIPGLIKLSLDMDKARSRSKGITPVLYVGSDRKY